MKFCTYFAAVLCIGAALWGITPALAQGAAALPSSAASGSDNLLNLPSEQELREELEKVRADTGLNETAKQERSADLEDSLKFVRELEATRAARSELESQLQDREGILRDLELRYQNAKEGSASPAALPSDLSAAQLEQRQAELKGELEDAQQRYTDTAAALSEVQTLPERAQNAITADNERIKTLLTQMSEGEPGSLRNRRLGLEVAALRAHSDLLSLRLKEQPFLADVASYEQRLAALHYEELSSAARALQEQRGEALSAELNRDGESDQDSLQHTEVRAGAKLLQDTLAQIGSHRKSALNLSGLTQDVVSATSELKQLQSSVDSELQGLDDSILLSRLLNRQQLSVPDIKLDVDLDELIPVLNLDLYDIREKRDALFDIPAAVARIVARHPETEPFKEILREQVTQQKELLGQLYQEISSEHQQALELKLKYADYAQLRGALTALITERLFWLKSNYPLGGDFLRSIPQALNHQWQRFLTRLQSESFWLNAARTALTVLAPLILLSLAILYFGPALRRRNNTLAQRLDRADDSIFVTAQALLNRLVFCVPQTAVLTIIGSLFICLSLSDSVRQVQAILMMLLHVFMFALYLELSKPNSLFQRHFSLNPDALQRDRRTWGRFWLCAIPLLIAGNITELDPSEIFYDVTGYVLVLLCCLGMLSCTLPRLFEMLKQRFYLSPQIWLLVLAGLAMPVGIAAAVGSGYYYTTMKLINRLAYTCYIGLLFYVASGTARRAMYVSESALFRRRLQHADAARKSEGNRALEHIRVQAFRLINYVMLLIAVVFIYRQWSDLASVLSYLDNVKLWQVRDLADGREVVKDELTLGDLLLSVVILAVTVLLNRNLPSLLERLLSLRTGAGTSGKGTAYTVRIVTSYIIMAGGLVLAAGALGIHWDKLQWLVAALSVGLGFGLQEIFANFVSGLIILFERQIRVGDIITLNSLSGTVSKIRIRSTTVISFDNKEVMIPNRQFITSALTNWSLTNSVTKLEFEVGVAYDADVEQAKALLLDIARRCPHGTRVNEPLVYVKSLEDSSVNLMCELYVEQIGKRKATVDYLCTQTLSTFAAHGIEIPYNKLDVNFRPITSSADQAAEAASAPTQAAP